MSVYCKNCEWICHDSRGNNICKNPEIETKVARIPGCKVMNFDEECPFYKVKTGN